MTDHGLLTPGSARTDGAVDDAALLDAMVRVEVAWLRALANAGAHDPDLLKTMAGELSGGARLDADEIGRETEGAGNPVVAVVGALRRRVGDPDVAGRLHGGLTSQDVLDTALMLLTRDGLDRIAADLERVIGGLARLARCHRDAVMAGRTLTQYAVPVTFGLKAAQWLLGVLDVRDDVRRVATALPVQCGGAAGTRSLLGELVGDPDAAVAEFATELGMVPSLPWHTRRGPVTRVADALVRCCDALGVIGSDVATLSRPEIGEVREAAAAGRGRSSTMPQKHNPVLSILVRSAGLQAPLLGAQLHLAAVQAVDERPDGAWHAEWPSWRRLLELTITSAAQAAELVEGLEVDPQTMRRRAQDAAAELLAERGDDGAEAGDPASYLGSAGAFVDAVLAKVEDSHD
jgi:3-carboxy-cis,cis-muconate cycloisomerase